MSDVAVGALGRVSFGRLDAESDKNLLDYFITVGTAADALKGKHLVLGRKGAGKTALFTYVASNAPGTIVKLDLKDYVFQAHRSLRDEGVADAFVYTESWRFAYLIAMFLEGRKHMPWRLRWRGTKIVKRLGAGPDKAPVLAIMDWLGRIRKMKLISIAGLADLGGYESDAKQPKPFQPTTRRLVNDLQSVIKQAVEKRPITVLVDRLDDAWKGTDDSLDLIVGAARAARQLAEDIPQQGVAPAIVFLRSDLWDKCDFNDKNKFAQDTVTLNWSDHDLARVVDQRIHKTADIPEDEGWGVIFTDIRMRQGTSAQKYMLKRCLGRPRDVVSFAITALDVARKNEHDRIEKQDIYEAEAAYSAHVLKELHDEISRHVQDMEDVVNALKGLERRKFALSTWDAAAARAGLDKAEQARVLDLLFDAGAIGVLRANNQIAYRYNDSELKLEETGALSVHPALVKELSLIDA